MMGAMLELPLSMGKVKTAAVLVDEALATAVKELPKHHQRGTLGKARLSESEELHVLAQNNWTSTWENMTSDPTSHQIGRAHV